MRRRCCRRRVAFLRQHRHVLNVRVDREERVVARRVSPATPHLCVVPRGVRGYTYGTPAKGAVYLQYVCGAQRQDALRLWYTSTEGARSRFVRVYSQFSQCARIRVNTVRHGRAAPRIPPRVSPRGAAVRLRRLRLRAPRRRRWRCLGLQRKRACALHSCRARSQRIGVDPGMPRGRCNAQPTR